MQILFFVLACWSAADPQYAPPEPTYTVAAGPPPLFETTPTPVDYAPPSEQVTDAAPPATDEQYSAPIDSSPAPAPPAQQYGLPSL